MKQPPTLPQRLAIMAAAALGLLLALWLLVVAIPRACRSDREPYATREMQTHEISEGNPEFLERERQVRAAMESEAEQIRSTAKMMTRWPP